jgi:hypothetical protein
MSGLQLISARLAHVCLVVALENRVGIAREFMQEILGWNFEDTAGSQGEWATRFFTSPDLTNRVQVQILWEATTSGFAGSQHVCFSVDESMENLRLKLNIWCADFSFSTPPFMLYFTYGQCIGFS